MALASDSTSPFRVDEVCLADVWAELKAGKLKVVSAASSESDHTLTLSYSVLNGDHTPAAELRTLEQALLRGYQRVALDLGVAPSEVVRAAKAASAWIGVSGMPTRTPPLVAFSVLAAHRGSKATVRREWREHVRLSMPRPEVELGSQLSVQEMAIVGLLVEGVGHQGVAEKHGLGGRVAATCISRIFAKLDVEGRRDLVALAFSFVDRRAAEP